MSEDKTIMLPQPVANSLDALRKTGINALGIAWVVGEKLNGRRLQTHIFEINAGIIASNIIEGKLGMDVFMRAIALEDYCAKPSPEERLREYFRYHVEDAEDSRSNGVCEGIERTLEILSEKYPDIGEVLAVGEAGE